jgi:uracil phosphoribosyltransferase
MRGHASQILREKHPAPFAAASSMVVLDHPLVYHWLAELRDETTPPPRFRDLVRRLTGALFLRATQDLPLAEGAVRTPMTETSCRTLAAVPVLVPVLRAGLGMVEGALAVLPECSVHHVGLYRDHETLEAVSYYEPRPPSLPGATALVLDPMLATGGSAVATLDLVKRWDVAAVRLLCIIGAPEGVQRVEEAHPDVEIYLCALDERLNELGYILPGLGDAGDRQFGA